MLDKHGKDNVYYQDESGFDEYFTRRYGYSYGGNKIYTKLSAKRYERQSVMGLLNHKNQLIEPMIYKDTTNANTVYAYFETVLPTLKPNSVVIMDNASFHKSPQLQALFEKYQCILMFLPPYSPDLNPIENMWGTIKQHLRSYYDYSLSLFDNLCNVVNHYSL
jgi:transposase